MNSQKCYRQTAPRDQSSNRLSNRLIDFVTVVARLASAGEASASTFAVLAIQAVQTGLGGVL